MAISRQVITTLNKDGSDALGMDKIAIKFADESIVSGSLLTVEANQYCVLKSRGAVLKVYETGQFQLSTPDKPIIGSIVQNFFGGNSPWVYEVIYINKAKLRVHSKGQATTREMAQVKYEVDYYIHIDSQEGALALVTHLPFNGNSIDLNEIAEYAKPAIEQSINQVVQVTKLEDVNLHISEIIEGVKAHLSEFLSEYGISLQDIKVLVLPSDERMMELLSLRAFGLTEQEAIRYYLALEMAKRGLISAPNAANGTSFNIGSDPSGVMTTKVLGG